MTTWHEFGRLGREEARDRQWVLEELSGLCMGVEELCKP